MPRFEFSGSDVLIDGVSTAQVAQTLSKAGILEHKVGEILGHWYRGATGSTKPAPFDFTTDVQAHDPACEVTYARTFAHVDWVDGEDRVQAAATPEELGFNARFHAIENEFDAVAAQLRSLGACAADLRADLVGVVRELESRLTAIQNDVHELRQAKVAPEPLPGKGMGVLGTVKVGQKEAFIAQWGNDFHLVEFAGDLIGKTVSPKPGRIDEGRVFAPSKIRPEEVVDLYAGVEDVLTYPGIVEVLGRDGATVADLRGVAGGTTLPDGQTLASVIASMPADQRLDGVAGAVQAIGAHIAEVLPEETAKKAFDAVVVDESVRAGSRNELRNAGAGSLGVSAETSAALDRAGVASVSALAGSTTTALVGRLAAEGAEGSVSALRTAVARARVATALRGRIG